VDEYPPRSGKFAGLKEIQWKAASAMNESYYHHAVSSNLIDQPIALDE
jgi:hypothetical protein